MYEQAVLVNLPLQGESDDFGYIEALGERLAERVEKSGVGEFDGNLIGPDWAVVYLYGSDAERLWEAIEEALRAASLPAGAYVIKQHGAPGGPETRVDL